MPADALATLGARASAGMVLTLIPCIFHLQHPKSKYKSASTLSAGTHSWLRSYISINWKLLEVSMISSMFLLIRHNSKLLPRFCKISWDQHIEAKKNGCHFTDNTFKCIFLNENVGDSIKISLKFVRKSPVDNIPALGQIMAWCRPGNKPLSEPMMVTLPMHIYASLDLNELTLQVLNLEYSERTKSISWLLIPWLYRSPRYQQPW